MTASARATAAVAALVAIVGITVSWWALALWPVDSATPEWFLRTREVCFGSVRNGLPNAGGWLLLVGQPLGMLTILAVVWPEDLSAGFARLMRHLPGQIVTGAVAAGLVAGLAGVAVRVAGASIDTFSPGTAADQAAVLTRIDDAPPETALIDQHGTTVTLDQFSGRPVLVTFAYAHCDTVCPLVVNDVTTAAARLVEQRPAVLVITLDPWRDTPGRLGAMAGAWRLFGDARVLSGDPARVERTLNAWRIPRVRNDRTGELSHPALVYVLGADQRIHYVVPGGVENIIAAVKRL